ncbi:hypothetical protein KAI56_05025 [Candidatus Parcubacteria bacterium]|nr:hypothetical protein [Candidatus Parcubacteria bacterium]
MSIKKTTFITVFISAIFVSASFMVAQAYEPLVRLPGLPTEGTINLSQYVVGLYNFLLSIVGIVAVMMLIIGGMKYITAAGNASVIGDAKDTISSAIFGLLLALLSWVIVSTINPDVLFIKNPASSLVGGYTADHGACGEWDGAVCTCKDESVPTAAVATKEECNTACSGQVECELTEPSPCIKAGSSEKTVRGRCTCVDEAVVISLGPAGTSCNDICQTPTLVTDGKNHCYVVDFRMGKANIDEAFYLPSDKDRARKFAVYNGDTWDSAIKIVEGCHTYINAGDYTTKFSDLIHLQIDNGSGPGFDGNCWGAKVWPLDLLAQPDKGYFGIQIPLGPEVCLPSEIMASYVIWTGDANCKNGENGSVICPIRICAEYSDSAKITNTKYLELIKP